ncbi:hypothetical protein [Labrys sp. 22185]|uniref:hypothetical protein n=1 Tax=Labrys sp. 22185 TaxID=3453888 RepID=UPI003F87BF12
MRFLIAAAIALGATFALATPSSAMPVSQPDNPSLVQTVRDRTCNAPSRTARCKWYGMPGVHRGPRWLRQHGGEGYRHRHHHRRNYRHHRRA